MSDTKVDVLAVMDDTANFARCDNSWNGMDEADFQAARAAVAELIEAAKNYYTGYCQDEADEDDAAEDGGQDQQVGDAEPTQESSQDPVDRLED